MIIEDTKETVFIKALNVYELSINYTPICHIIDSIRGEFSWKNTTSSKHFWPQKKLKIPFFSKSGLTIYKKSPLSSKLSIVLYT